MRHPKDRSGLTRGQLLRGAAAAAAGVGVAGGLAACENTTTPLGACEDASAAGGSPLVEPKPVGPGGLPLPRNDNSVTWAITDDNPQDRRRAPARDGEHAAPLQLPGLHLARPPAALREALRLQGRRRHLQLGGRGDREAPVRRRRLRRHPRALGLEHRQPDRAAAPAAAQPLLPPEPRRRTSGPSSPIPSTTGARTTRSRTSSGRTASAGGTTSSPRTSPAMDVPWDIFWESHAYYGKVGLLDDKRDGLSMPMQRDAMREERIADLNTEDEAIVEKAGKDLQQLKDICNIKPTITDYQTLPEGTKVLHHSWSGDLLGGRVLLHAARRQPRRPLVLGARGQRRRPERLPLRDEVGEEPRARPPVPRLPHGRDDRVRQLRQLQRLRPPAERDRRRCARRRGSDPRDARNGRRPPRPVPRQPGAPPADGRGRAVLGPGLVRSSRPGRRVDGVSLDVAGAGGARGRLAHALLPRRLLRGDLRRVREPEHAQRAGAVLEPARLERRLRAAGARELLERRGVPHGLPAHVRVRVDRDRALPARRLSRRLLRGPAHGQVARAHPAPARAPLLDQLPDADARLDQPALAGRLGHEGPPLDVDRPALHLARPALDRGRLARGAADDA